MNRADQIVAVLAAAQDYLGREWQPLPVPFGSKNPGRDDWQTERRTADDIEAAFGTRLVNVGIMTGEPSGGLIDVDLDTTESVALAPTFLPKTGAVFGRPGRPASHWLYVADEPGITQQFKAPGGAMLVEYRSTGGQTIAPPSVTSERVRWDRDGQPTRIEGAILLRQVQQLAAATLLARCWPERGSRHDASMALAGGLLRAGWTEDDTAELVVAVATTAGDEEALNRAADVRTTARRLAEGGAATGWTTLRQIMGDKAVRKVRTWLGVTSDATSDTSTPDQDGGDSPGMDYVERSGRLFWRKPTKDGHAIVQLANFTARVTGNVVLDDGAETRRQLEIEATLRGRTRVFALPSERFSSMNWTLDQLGPGAIIAPGMGLKEQLRVAIQGLSEEAEERIVFAHLGWRQLDGGWAYLHAGGAIGNGGAVPNVEVRLSDALAGYVLPSPASTTDTAEAVRASLRMLAVAPRRVTVPAFGAVYRAAVAAADCGLHLVGPTGAGKTEIAALGQQHYGPGLDARNLPASWSSTGNALEGVLFAAKDALVVIDDFCPTGSSADVQRYHRDADRVFRAQGNRSGRQRMRPDATLRPTKPPRGLAMSTGEDTPRGQSLRSRVGVLEVGPSDVNWSKLTVCQADARNGLYAQALVGFVGWLAPRYDDVRARMRADLDALRTAAYSDGQHRRTPGIVADLAYGLKLFLVYARDVGAVTDDEAETLWAEWWRALGEMAAAQAQHQAASEPTRRFLDLLRSALASGRAHLARQDGDEPRSPEAWGWRSVTVGAGQYERAEWRPSGERVGWVDNDGQYLYLEPDAAYTVAQRLARDGGDTLPVTPQILWKRLKERKLLASVDEKRQTLKIRRTFQRQQHDVLHLHTSALLPPTAPDKPDNEPDSGLSGGDEEGAMSGSMSGEVSGLDPNPTPHSGDPLREAAPNVGFVGSSGGDRQPNSETRTFDEEPMSGPVSGGPDDPTPDPAKPDTGAARRAVWRCACTAFERHRRLDGGWICSGCGQDAPAPEVAA